MSLKIIDIVKEMAYHPTSAEKMSAGSGEIRRYRFWVCSIEDPENNRTVIVKARSEEKAQMIIKKKYPYKQWWVKSEGMILDK